MDEMTESEKRYRAELEKLRAELRSRPFANDLKASISQKEGILASIRVERAALQKTQEYSTAQSLSSFRNAKEFGFSSGNSEQILRQGFQKINPELAKKLQENLDAVAASGKNATASVRTLGDSLASLALAVVSIKALESAFEATIKKGIDLNAQFESMQLGIAAVVAGASQDVDSLNRKLTIKQKLELSTQEAQLAMVELREKNRETIATLPELTEAFQSALAPARSLGLSTKEVVSFTKDMANAAAAIGMPMNQLSQEIRAVLEGDMSRNSRVNQILQIRSETIKAQAAAGTLSQYLQNALKDYAAFGEEVAQTHKGVVSNIKDDIDMILAESTKGLFDEQKRILTTLESFLYANRENISRFGKEISQTLLSLSENTVDIGGEAFDLLSSFLVTIGDGVRSLEALAYQLSELFTGVRSEGEGTLTLFGYVNLSVDAFAVGVQSLIGLLQVATNGLSQLASAAEIALVKAKRAVGFSSESDIERLQEMYDSIAQKERSNQAIVDRLNARVAKMNEGVESRKINAMSRSFFEGFGDISLQNTQEIALVYEHIHAERSRLIAQSPALEKAINAGYERALESLNRLSISQHSAQSSLLAKPVADEKAIQEHKKALDEYQKYVDEAFSKSLQNRHEQELLAEHRKFQALIGAHQYTLKEREELERAFNARVGAITQEATEALLQKEREAYIEYYKTIGEKSKAAALENQKLLERVSTLALTEEQKRKMITAKEADFERDSQIERLKSWEKYYKAVGDTHRANSARIQREALNMEKEGYTKEQTADMMFGEQTKKHNYDNLYQASGVDTGVSGQLQERLRSIEEFQRIELERINQFYATKEASAEAHAAKMQEIEAMRFQGNLATASAGFSAMGQLAKAFYDASGRENKTALRVYQAASVAQAIINTYTAASKALAIGGPISGPVMAGVAIAQGMAQVAMIKAQKFHTGGFVDGAGEVPAVLLSGEGVLSREGMKNLDALNLGEVNTTESDASITIINTLDPGVIEQWASSRSGRKIIKNIINGG